MSSQLEFLWRFFGVNAGSRVSHREAIVSAVGGCFAIAAVLSVSEYFVGQGAAGLLVASMGASAVLLFAAPHGPLSQPWPLLGGHLVSAFIGVMCSTCIERRSPAAALAVGLSIGVMLSLRCVHPPGGATALSAVIGSQPVRELGFNYLLTPVLLNAVIVLGVAIGFNSLFGWRRYPAYFAGRERLSPSRGVRPSVPAHNEQSITNSATS